MTRPTRSRVTSAGLFEKSQAARVQLQRRPIRRRRSISASSRGDGRRRGYLVIRYKEEEARRDRLSEEGTPLATGPSVVFKNAPNPNAHVLFQNWMHSREARSSWSTGAPVFAPRPDQGKAQRPAAQGHQADERRSGGDCEGSRGDQEALRPDLQGVMRCAGTAAWEDGHETNTFAPPRVDGRRGGGRHVGVGTRAGAGAGRHHGRARTRRGGQEGRPGRLVCGDGPAGVAARCQGL